MSDRRHAGFSMVLLFFLSALVMLRQFGSTGIYSWFASDTYIYTSWAAQFVEALKEGTIYPRWLPFNFWGYGSPIFILYPPFAFYLVGFFDIFTQSVIGAMNITKFTALFLSAAGMFLLVREFYSGRIALLTASLYILFPYNIFWIYLGASFATPISLIWFSPIILFVYRYFKYRAYKYLICAGAFYGGLILTHLIVAYMFTFVITAFILYLSALKRRPEAVAAIPVLILTGVAVSAAYCLPLVFEKGFFNLKDFGDGLVFSDFFVLPDMTDRVPASHFWPILYGQYVDYIIFYCACLVLLFVQAVRLGKVRNMEEAKAVNRFFGAVAAGSLFLLFGASEFIWRAIPFFEMIQYPVRWLSITYFAVIFLFAAAFQSMALAHKKTRIGYHVLTGLLFLSCVLLDYRYVNSSHVFTVEELAPFQGVNWAREHLPAGVAIETISGTGHGPERVRTVAGEGEADIVTWESAERVIKVAAQTPVTTRIRTFVFPGWRAYTDGIETTLKTEEGSGAMLVDVPQGNHTLTLRFVDTPPRHYGKIVSLFSSAIIILFLLFYGRNNRHFRAGRVVR